MKNVDQQLPAILVTGASGFIGRHFVIAVCEKFRLFCIARRSQKEAGIARNANIHWLQADIKNPKKLDKVQAYVRAHGGADYVLHLAGYYDFTQKENPAYEQINVSGTRNVLAISQLLGVKRFIFSSSLAACRFPAAGRAVTEDTPADEDFPYARSKQAGETLVRQYSQFFPCAIVRLAAVFSDWCEYPMLYMLLKYWTSNHKLMSRVLAGHGEAAIPYIHIKDLIKLFLQIMHISATLPRLATYNGSPSGCVSQRQLFKAVTRYHYGHDIRPIYVPRPLVRLGLVLKSFWGRLRGRDSLEQPWMAAYTDKKLIVDAAWTHKALNWHPTPRLGILRRLLIMTEKKASHPDNWTFRNEILIRKVAFRKSTAIYDILAEVREPLVQKLIAEVRRPESARRFPNYQRMDPEMLRWYITLNYKLVATTVKNRDRSIIPAYAQEIACIRYAEGFKVDEVKNLMLTTGRFMEQALLARQELKGSKHRVDDYIILTSQLAADELEDTYEILKGRSPEPVVSIRNVESQTVTENLKRIVEQFEDIYD